MKKNEKKGDIGDDNTIDDLLLNKNEKIENKTIFLTKKIFFIKNGKIFEGKKENIKKEDYILSHDEFIIVDKDKESIRPFVEDMLRKLNIETKNTKLIRLNILIVMGMMVISIFSLFVVYPYHMSVVSLNKSIYNMSGSLANTSADIQVLTKKIDMQIATQLASSGSINNINSQLREHILNNNF